MWGSAPDGPDVPGDTALAHTRRALKGAGFRDEEIDAGLTTADLAPLARLVTDDFLAGTYGRVDIVYSLWVSTLVQRPTIAPDVIVEHVSAKAN